MNDQKKKQLFNLLKSYKQEGLVANQYDLEELSEGNISADTWSELLREPDVQKYIKLEMEVIRNAEVNKMIKDSADSRSVGQSQLLNALTKLDTETQEDKGPAFIYCYVPLTEEQQHAKNVLPFQISTNAPDNLEDLMLSGFKYDLDELEELEEDNGAKTISD